MAMKLSPAEKAADNAIRAYNAQIEKAIKTLGREHTVTQNLINKARSVYGASAIKEMKNKQGYEIPQIKRNRETVSNSVKYKALKNATQYKDRDNKTRYKSMFDVTRAQQKALTQLSQSKLKQTPNAAILEYNRNVATLEGMKGTKINGVKAEKTKEYKELQKAVKTFEREQKSVWNKQDFSRQLYENDLASEIFDAYEQAKEDGDDTELYEDFANRYHSGDDFDYDLLLKIRDQRYNDMLNKAMDNPKIEDTLQGSKLNEWLNSFELIYNPFE